MINCACTLNIKINVNIIYVVRGGTARNNFFMDTVAHQKYMACYFQVSIEAINAKYVTIPKTNSQLIAGTVAHILQETNRPILF